MVAQLELLEAGNFSIASMIEESTPENLEEVIQQCLDGH